jgi:hypothetical protein
MLGTRRLSVSTVKSLLTPPRVRGHRRVTSAPENELPRISIDAPRETDTVSITEDLTSLERSHSNSNRQSVSSNASSVKFLTSPTQRWSRPNSFHGVSARPFLNNSETQSVFSSDASSRRSISSLHPSDLLPFPYNHYLDPQAFTSSHSQDESEIRRPNSASSNRRSLRRPSDASDWSQGFFASINRVLEESEVPPALIDFSSRFSMSRERPLVDEAGPSVANNSRSETGARRLSFILREIPLSLSATVNWVVDHSRRGHSRTPSASSMSSAMSSSGSSSGAISFSAFPNPPANNSQFLNSSASQVPPQTSIAAVSQVAPPAQGLSLFPTIRENPLASEVHTQLQASRARMIEEEERYLQEIASSGRSSSPDSNFDRNSDRSSSQYTRKTVSSNAASEVWPVNAPMRGPRARRLSDWSVSSGARSFVQWIMGG